MDDPRQGRSGSAEDLLAGLRRHAPELLGAGQAHQHGLAQSVRTAHFRGHTIRITTTYEVTVDGQPFPINPSVDNAGRVHYHGLPTRSFPSAVDLVADAIDAFPDDFADPPDDHPHHPLDDGHPHHPPDDGHPHHPPPPDDGGHHHGHADREGPR